MVQPTIRLAHSADGTRVAFAESGRGPAMVAVPSIGITLRYTGPRAAPLLGDFCIRSFDRRGTGSSSRDTPITRELLARDCLAVADDVGPGSFHIYANRLGMFEAVHLAVERADRARGLVLHHPYPQSGWADHPRQQSWIKAGEADWDWFAESFIRSWGEPDPDKPMSRDLVENFKSTNDQASFSAMIRVLAGWDISHAVSQVRVPTLIIHRAALWHPIEVAESYAKAIPGARLVIDHGPEPMHLTSETQEAMRSFFVETLPADEVPASWRARPLRPKDARASCGLSRREREVLKLVAGGFSNREIAEVLVIAAPTVASHLRHIFDKLDVENRAAAAAWAVRDGLAP
jgi:DNA-binding CsgD family transcriptional regulator/pimeloyl-ACP methyl ester carboxylesterase